MKKAIYSKNGMKQLISSGWKLFDKQTNCISTGNVISNTQFSSFIRPWNETECNGYTFSEGHLMNCDLEPFRKYRIPKQFLNLLEEKSRQDGVILYMFFVYKNGVLCPFSWVVTSSDDKLIKKAVVCSYNENKMKRFNALYEILNYITI